VEKQYLDSETLLIRSGPGVRRADWETSTVATYPLAVEENLKTPF
jgi:hypothetical protein